MDLLVIGDVHGCFYTLRKLVDEHWDPQRELLIQIGDLINKGLHSAKCLKYWMQLEKNFPGKTIFIKGNHEYNFEESLKGRVRMAGFKSILAEFEKEGLIVDEVKNWLRDKPLKWENPHILITHAGISKDARDPYDQRQPNSVLFNKGSLKILDKVQVKGHSIVEGHKPVFKPSENAWYIDTGAWARKKLSAIRYDEQGNKKAVIRVDTQPEDQSFYSKLRKVLSV